MSNVTEIEQAVERLSPEELRVFRDWFVSREATEWDRQFEADVLSGRLDSLADEALADLKAGKCSDL